MNYTELADDMDVDLDLVTKINLLRNATLPDVEASPDDPALEHLQEAKQRYVKCVNEIIETSKFIDTKQSDLDTISELLKTLGPAVGSYKETLSNVLSDFEMNEGLTEARTKLARSTSDYISLRKVFELVEEPSRYLCFTCLDRSIEQVYIPCGHTVCTICSDRMIRSTNCPFCRSPIMNRQKMFLA
jgi:hypothetical protein